MHSETRAVVSPRAHSGKLPDMSLRGETMHTVLCNTSCLESYSVMLLPIGLVGNCTRDNVQPNAMSSWTTHHYPRMQHMTLMHGRNPMTAVLSYSGH